RAAGRRGTARVAAQRRAGLVVGRSAGRVRARRVRRPGVRFHHPGPMTLGRPPRVSGAWGMAFRNRAEAGQRLAQAVQHLHGTDVVVLGIPRGGVPVAVGCEIVRAQGAARVVVASPVAAGEAVTALERVADEVVCPVRPGWFRAVGQWYSDFSEMADEQIVALLGGTGGAASGVAGGPGAAPAAEPGARSESDAEVTIPAGSVELAGQLTVPAGAVGLVVFAHGSGSSRHSPRNRYVAGILQRAGLGTLLFDLLTTEEEGDSAAVFNIGLLGGRLVQAIGWLGRQAAGTGLPTGVFGASTGAAAALWAAAEPDSPI